jgi:hypothetical protein
VCFWFYPILCTDQCTEQSACLPPRAPQPLNPLKRNPEKPHSRAAFHCRTQAESETRISGKTRDRSLQSRHWNAGYAYRVNHEEAVIQLNSECKIGRSQSLDKGFKTYATCWEYCSHASMEL